VQAAAICENYIYISYSVLIYMKKIEVIKMLSSSNFPTNVNGRYKAYSLRFNIIVVPTQLGSLVLVQTGCQKRQYFTNGVFHKLMCHATTLSKKG
jgi:hypothetical protein